MQEAEGEIVDEVDPQQITEDYNIWKKNTPFLYDTVLTQMLDWPSLTVDWLPGKEEIEDADYSAQKLVLGTHTNREEQDHIIVATVRLPNKKTALAGSHPPSSKNPANPSHLLSQLESKIERFSIINHEGEINKARHMPQRPSLLATKTSSGEVHVFDIKKHPVQTEDEEEPRPEMKLVGQEKEGFGLDWSPVTAGLIASGADDQIVCVWDINRTPHRTTVTPIKQFRKHTSIVSDVSWSSHSPHILASCGDDKLLLLWDTRQSDPTHTITAHSNEVNSVDFNKVEEFVLATGSSDCTVALWDCRNLSVQMAQLEHHKDCVYHVHWAPFSRSILASGGSDRRVCIWDVSRLGEEQGEEDNEDGPPELLFIHAGHTASISDLCWNPNDEMVLASVAEDNILHVWEMSHSLLVPPTPEDDIQVE